MPFLYQISLGEVKGKMLLTSQKETASLVYHDLFDFPLTGAELIKWSVGNRGGIKTFPKEEIQSKAGFYFLSGKAGVVYKRLLKKRISRRKLLIAQKTARILNFVPSIKLVAVTGALAMENASDEADIDLMVITKTNTLWVTRLLVYLILAVFLISVRRAGKQDQRDKLCFNLWLDEKALAWDWHDRNIYTAHEIAQIKPLVNKNKTYERFLIKNKWALDYWPNSVKRLSEKEIKLKVPPKKHLISLFEMLAFKLQYLYMKRKITREIITPHKAIFHPHDWGKVILQRFSSLGLDRT